MDVLTLSVPYLPSSTPPVQEADLLFSISHMPFRPLLGLTMYHNACCIRSPIFPSLTLCIIKNDVRNYDGTALTAAMRRSTPILGAREQFPWQSRRGSTGFDVSSALLHTLVLVQLLLTPGPAARQFSRATKVDSAGTNTSSSSAHIVSHAPDASSVLTGLTEHNLASTRLFHQPSSTRRKSTTHQTMMCMLKRTHTDIL